MDVSEQPSTSVISEKEIESIVIESDLPITCQQFGVNYVPACPNETAKQTKNPRDKLQKLIKVSKNKSEGSKTN